MKNVTLAIDEDLLVKARGLAVKRKTTLNALIRALLQYDVEQDDRIAEARRGMVELMDRSTLELAPGTDVKELSRSRGSRQLHRHEHPDTGRRKKAG